jgi:hypothetical protein
MTPFFSQPGGKYHLKAGADEQEHQPWYGVPAPAVNSIWPDSKEVEAGTEGQFEDGSLSQTQLEELILSKQECSSISASGQGLWGDGNAHNEQMSMDSMSGIISSPDGSVLNEVNGENNRVNKWDLKRVADGEGNKEELLASNSGGKSRSLPMGDKLSFLTRSEATMNGISFLDTTKRQNLNKLLTKPPGKVMDGPLNGIMRLVDYGNGPQFKTLARVTGFENFQPEGCPQLQYGDMYRPPPPPLLIQQHTHPPAVQQCQQASHGLSNSLFPNLSFKPQPPSLLHSNGSCNDSAIARIFATLGPNTFSTSPSNLPCGNGSPIFGANPNASPRTFLHYFSDAKA